MGGGFPLLDPMMLSILWIISNEKGGGGGADSGSYGWRLFAAALMELQFNGRVAHERLDKIHSHLGVAAVP